MSQRPLKYSIVIPAYAEEKVIGGSLMLVKKLLIEQNIEHVTEVIVVTADSNDDTHQIVARELKKFKHAQHLKPGPRVGKGRDVRLGIQSANGDYVLFTDADMATPVHHIVPAFAMLEGGADVVIGVRDLTKIHDGFRYYLSNMSNILIQLVLLPGIKDSQCGFKGFTRASAKTIFSRQTIMGWGFDMEVLKIAREHKYQVTEMPIDDWADPKLEDSLVGDSAVRVMLKTLRELWQIRVLSWRRKYR